LTLHIAAICYAITFYTYVDIKKTQINSFYITMKKVKQHGE